MQHPTLRKAMLEYKTLYGDLLVFKNNNDCMTINRGPYGRVDVDSIEIEGEKLEYEDCDWNLLAHPKNTFTTDEASYFIKHYQELVGYNY